MVVGKESREGWGGVKDCLREVRDGVVDEDVVVVEVVVGVGVVGSEVNVVVVREVEVRRRVVVEGVDEVVDRVMVWFRRKV